MTLSMYVSMVLVTIQTHVVDKDKFVKLNILANHSLWIEIWLFFEAFFKWLFFEVIKVYIRKLRVSADTLKDFFFFFLVKMLRLWRIFVKGNHNNTPKIFYDFIRAQIIPIFNTEYKSLICVTIYIFHSSILIYSCLLIGTYIIKI